VAEFFNKLLASDFMPHGVCFLWNPEIIWLHAISDTIITISYYLIPLALVYFVRKRQDLPFNWMFLMFGLFIFGCGTTHLMEVWTLWHGTYRLAGAIKAVTAAASVVTAILLVRLVPDALALPSPAQLQKANEELEQEIGYRRRAERALLDALLQQVIVNLVMNGLDAMSAVSDRPRRLTISARVLNDGRVAVSVTDSGVGVDPTVFERLFEPFFSAKPHGMGMGLSVSRSIVQRHGGQLWAAMNTSGHARRSTSSCPLRSRYDGSGDGVCRGRRRGRSRRRRKPGPIRRTGGAPLRVGRRLPGDPQAQRSGVPDSRRADAGPQWIGLPAPTCGSRLPHSHHLHDRSRRHPDVGPGDEGGRVRIPD